jgi:cold shock protein
MQGTVKFFKADKGYGFIKPDDGGDDVFVHASAISDTNRNSLAQGDAVEYNVVKGKNGKFQAADVQFV